MKVDIKELENFLDDHIQDLVDLRRELHKKAELSGDEKKTAEFVIKVLKETNPDKIIENVGGCGVIAVYGEEKSGPDLMIRAELDALPIPDSPDLEYASENPDTGHKCGHDGHMTIVLGVARWLGENKPPKGRVYLLFQPAEETGEGAARILKDEKFSEISPYMAMALHNLPGYPAHSVIVREGTFTSASVGIEMKLKGTSSHAGYPEDGRSPAAAMAQIVNMLPGIAAQEFPRSTNALITIIHASVGKRAFGTTPGNAVVMATLRANSNEVLKEMKTHVLKRCRAIAESWGLTFSEDFVEPFDATINDDSCVDILTEAAEKLDLKIIRPDNPFPWSEDFGAFSQKFTGLLFCLGSGKEHPQLHHPDYDFPDELLQTGIKLFLLQLHKYWQQAQN